MSVVSKVREEILTAGDVGADWGLLVAAAAILSFHRAAIPRPGAPEEDTVVSVS